MRTPYDDLRMHLICPCGECALNPAHWECKGSLKPGELEEAKKAFLEFKAKEDLRREHD